MCTINELEVGSVRGLEAKFLTSESKLCTVAFVGAKNRENNKTWMHRELYKIVWDSLIDPWWSPNVCFACGNFIMLSPSTFHPFKQQKTLKFHPDPALSFLEVPFLKVKRYLRPNHGCPRIISFDIPVCLVPA